MADVIAPAPLRPGDQIRVIAPSGSGAAVSADVRQIAAERMGQLGLRVSYGRHVDDCDVLGSASVAARLADLHDAFEDDDVAAILTMIGGYNANQLLALVDWDLVGGHPKVLCGYSDITALTCAVHARTKLVTYSGPHFSTFGMRDHVEQTLTWFRWALTSDHPSFSVEPSPVWTDDRWYLDQDQRVVRVNEGYWVVGEGRAEGPLVGGNLSTLCLLHGTPYMPDLAGRIVFVEDDDESPPHVFDRQLTALTQQPGFAQVAGLLLGRFQERSGMTRATLASIVAGNRALDGLPILGNVDVGHTNPMLTIPIGVTGRMTASRAGSTLEIGE